MRVTHVATTGDAKKPQTQVKLGAVYSNDPESENRSFAQATPSAEVSMNIDAGRPAAQSFVLGMEFYVDFIPVGIPERTYLKDYYQVPHGEYILETRDRSASVRAVYGDKGWVIDGKQVHDWDKLAAEMGVKLEFWRHLREGE
jgi:hypothetical protein